MLRTTPREHQALSSTGHPGDRLVSPDDLRTLFATALSTMYREEVPLYGDLVRVVQETNEEVLQNRSVSTEGDSSQRISLERHGAIRLGSAYELQTVRRIFRLLGMHAVDYYDLSVAGLPMHATAFRPVHSEALAKNPFRVFTTLLRPELLKDKEARLLAERLLDRRSIFSSDLLGLLDLADSQGGCFAVDQIDRFISQALLTFRWRSTAAATDVEYKRLRHEHPILADIACFRSAHINHLTPRTLDIDAAYKSMRVAGLAVKDDIEGPPCRQNPIFLRQTSFLALQESVQFPRERSAGDEYVVHGHHKARFGEIEERGAALTPKGRKLYDKLLSRGRSDVPKGSNAEVRATALRQAFCGFPDDLERMRRDGLIYCMYQCSGNRIHGQNIVDNILMDRALVDDLIENGTLTARTITYEDFLPFSAAGIFQSNLKNSVDTASASMSNGAKPDQQGFEKALGKAVISSDELYQQTELTSMRCCAQQLGLSFDPQAFDD